MRGFAFVVCLGLSTASAQMQMSGTAPDEVLHITVGQSRMMHGASAMKRIFVGNPAVLSSFNSSPEEIVLTAKAPGVSSLAVWDVSGHERLYTIEADMDPSAMRRAVRSMYPGSTIDVQGIEDRLDITGDVASSDISDNLTKMAVMYTKQVANSVRVVPLRPKQVELKLRIVEVDRTKLDQFGVNVNYSGPKVPVSSTTQSFTNPLNVAIAYLPKSLQFNIQDLAQRNILQVLAEPTLTTISGQSAKFLSGGEFPVPIAQTSTGTQSAITVQFKPFGVKVDFTPTVNSDGTIRLKVAPEVSALDYTNAVTIAGFTIPALSTRRAETEVEIKDGQSFVLSGLLDHRTTESLGKVPGIANLPVLGQLFRSKNNTHSITELMVIVTATVVDPLADTPLKPEPAPAIPNMTRDHFDEGLRQVPGALKQP